MNEKVNKPTVLYNTYSTQHSHWVILYAPEDLKQPLHDIHARIDEMMTWALNSDDPSKFAQEIFALQQKREKLMDEVYSRSREAASHGRTVEHISLEILRDFLEIANKRLLAREVVAVGRVDRRKNKKGEETGVRIFDDRNREVIVFDGCGRIIESEYDDRGKLLMVRYLTDHTENMDHTAWAEDGTYQTGLQWITQYRQKGHYSQSRAFTGFGTLNYDWQ